MNLTTAQKLALTIGILGFVATGGTQLTDIFSPLGSIAPIIVKEIVSLAGFVSGVLGIILTFTTGQSGQIKTVVAMANDPNSPIQGIITTSDKNGQALAKSMNGPIVSAGTSAAAEIIKP
jgi:hypothetical protein